jgi:hypothetical protein
LPIWSATGHLPGEKSGKKSGMKSSIAATGVGGKGGNRTEANPKPVFFAKFYTLEFNIIIFAKKYLP